MGNREKEFEKKVSVGDLLRLKRQEKPDPAFWDQFDRELKQKTLQTIIKRPSLISRLGHVFALSLRPALPVASAALLALAFIHYNQISFTSNKGSGGLAVTEVKAEWSPGALEDLPKHYVTNVLSSQSSLSSKGVRYLAGNLSRTGIATAIKSNTLY